MKLYSVYDPEFAPYGQVLDSYDTSELLAAMESVPHPESGVAYQPSIDTLEACTDLFNELSNRAFGGMPLQFGMCWGHNTKLNCLEWHKSSEINVGTDEYILLLALKSDIVCGKLDTTKVKAFKAPRGVCVEIYSTALHYAPCQSNENGFRVAIVLPKGTNTEVPVINTANLEDKMLWARNKWLIAHPDTSEASAGAYVGLIGENINI